MKRVQHNEVKPGMKLRLTDGYGPRGRWVCIEHVYEIHTGLVPSAHVRAYWHSDAVKGGAVKRFGLSLIEREDGYELHPQSALLNAQEHQRKGRADAENVILREYSIKFSAVDRVDNQGETCCYCHEGDISCNIYATVTAESGRTEENAWSTCDACALYSIDQVEDVDPSYAITIERTGP